MMLHWGPELVTIYNDAYAPSLGHKHPGNLGRPAREWWSEMWDQLTPIFDKVLAGGSFRVENARYTPDRDGAPRDAYFTHCHSPLWDDEGRIAGIFLVVTETTRQVIAERDLVQANADLERQVAERTAAVRLFGNIVQSDRSPIVAFDRDLRVIGFNRAHGDAFERVMGLRQEVGDDLVAQFPTEQQGPLRSMMERALSGESFTVTEAFGNPDLSQPTWEISYAPLTDESGEVFAVFHVARDISDRVRAQAELAATQEALRQSQKMEAVGQLTGGIAHDFNNLLAGIPGSLEMIHARIAQGRHDEIDRYMTGAQGAARRAAALTHRLLAFSRRQTLDPKPTDVDRLAAGIEDMIQRTVGPAIVIERETQPGLWSTLVDPNQLENALLNLCINARDAMPDGGRITIRAANHRLDGRAAAEHDLPPGEYVSISVSDTGAGMAPDVIERAFEPFFTTKPIGVGTGLGLSMVYGFARQSGGQVQIASTVSQGTTISIFLPRHLVEETASPSVAAPPVRAGAVGKTVLVVDDDPLVRMLMVDAVEDLGFTAFEAEDGPQALSILRSYAYLDLRVTDVGLPNGMNGRQVADAARELRAGLRVLFVTGYAESTVLDEGHLGPDTQVITKPFDMAVLSNRITGMVGD